MMLKMLDWKMIKLWPKAGAAKGGRQEGSGVYHIHSYIGMSGQIGERLPCRQLLTGHMYVCMYVQDLAPKANRIEIKYPVGL